jgi:hypothetical protein
MLGLILVIVAGILTTIDVVMRPHPNYPGRPGWLLNVAVGLLCIAFIVGVDTVPLD